MDTIDDLRTRPTVLSDSEAARWDAWAATRDCGYQPSPAEIDYLANLARTDPEAFAQFDAGTCRDKRLYTRKQFLSFLSQHRGERLTTRQISDLSGCTLSYARHTTTDMIREQSPLIRRDGTLIEIL